MKKGTDKISPSQNDQIIITTFHDPFSRISLSVPFILLIEY